MYTHLPQVERINHAAFGREEALEEALSNMLRYKVNSCNTIAYTYISIYVDVDVCRYIHVDVDVYVYM